MAFFHAGDREKRQGFLPVTGIASGDAAADSGGKKPSMAFRRLNLKHAPPAGLPAGGVVLSTGGRDQN